ncbi:MAG: glycosyl hydrolase family 28-related protein [Fimbriimonas sp.]
MPMFAALAVLSLPWATLDVKTFGAMGDGATDDTKAFQAALTKAGETGGVVTVPAGKFLLKGTLDVPEGVTLEGSFRAPARTIFNEGKLEREKGSMLFTTQGRGQEDGTPFVTLHRNSTLKGLVVYYPEQTADIVPYPWCVRGIGDNVSVLDTLLVNPYQAVDLGTFPAGRHKVNGLYAHALKTGLFIDKCFDVGRVENVHFWPFWLDVPKVHEWTKRNGTAFRIAKTDWEYMANCFAIFYSVGYHFVTGPDGPGNATLTQCGSDVGPLAVKVDAVQRHAGVTFSNSQIMATVEVGPNNEGPVKFTSCGFWGVEKFTDEHARLAGRGHTTFTACHFIQGAQRTPGAPAIRATSGGVTLNGCEFLDDAKGTRHIELGPNVEAAVVSANRFRAKMAIANRSRGKVSILGNVGP